MRPSEPLSLIFLTLLLLGIAPACGVRFDNNPEGPRLVSAMELEGDLNAGAPLVLKVTVNQSYGVPLKVACFYEDRSRLRPDQLELTFAERGTLIGDEVLAPAPPELRPGDNVEGQDLSFRFRIDEPGDYKLTCLIPTVADSAIAMSLTIEDAPAGRP